MKSFNVLVLLAIVAVLAKVTARRPMDQTSVQARGTLFEIRASFSNAPAKSSSATLYAPLRSTSTQTVRHLVISHTGDGMRSYQVITVTFNHA